MSKKKRTEQKRREQALLRDRQCGPPDHPKRKYDNRFKAYEDAQIMTRLNKAPMSAYRCQHCGCWHIGHTPKQHQKAQG